MNKRSFLKYSTAAGLLFNANVMAGTKAVLNASAVSSDIISQLGDKVSFSYYYPNGEMYVGRYAGTVERVGELRDLKRNLALQKNDFAFYVEGAESALYSYVGDGYWEHVPQSDLAIGWLVSRVDYWMWTFR